MGVSSQFIHLFYGQINEKRKREKDFKKRGKKKKKRKKKKRKKEKKKERKVLDRSDILTLFEDIFNQRNTSSKRIVRDSVFLSLFSFLIKRKREKGEKP